MVIISSLSTLRHPKPHSSSFSSTWERLKAPFENQNSHHERPIFNSAQLNQLWAAENEANMSPLRKRTCLSVFELLLKYLSSEHSKHILKASRSPIFDTTLSSFENKIFVLSTSPNEHFGKEILTKISFGGQKIEKNIFFQFVQKSFFQKIHAMNEKSVTTDFLECV